MINRSINQLRKLRSNGLDLFPKRPLRVNTRPRRGCTSISTRINYDWQTNSRLHIWTSFFLTNCVFFSSVPLFLRLHIVNYGNSVSSPDLNVAYFVPIRVSLNTPFGNTRIKQTLDEGRDPTRWRVCYYINDPNTTHHGNHESLSRTPPLKRASHSAHSTQSTAQQENSASHHLAMNGVKVVPRGQMWSGA